ncbi:hypothetical protein EH243_00135 [Amphritea opalescens]|uniref:Uncharacterized protein n=1 Tax=Amphritea opalescens TaxID=2490544 RepID=A0A430KV92_9GAMM|nr:hypothetical protein [Amphritea opalescens]RTE67399.1 hypothetical protein EH243_00135 [Amphritea opalescens]
MQFPLHSSSVSGARVMSTSLSATPQMVPTHYAFSIAEPITPTRHFVISPCWDLNRLQNTTPHSPAIGKTLSLALTRAQSTEVNP